MDSFTRKLSAAQASSLLPGTLRQADCEGFARLKIPLELLRSAGIERVTDADAREKYGTKGYGDMCGIVFPYLDPSTGRRTTARLRRDHPEIEDGKLRNKYISAYGDRKHLYFSPGTAELLADKTVPLILVEAEKTVLALVAFSQRTRRELGRGRPNWPTPQRGTNVY